MRVYIYMRARRHYLFLCCEDFRMVHADTQVEIIYSIYILIGLRIIVGRWENPFIVERSSAIFIGLPSLSSSLPFAIESLCLQVPLRSLLKYIPSSILNLTQARRSEDILASISLIPVLILFFYSLLPAPVFCLSILARSSSPAASLPAIILEYLLWWCLLSKRHISDHYCR